LENSNWLATFSEIESENFESQSGEDGVIQKSLEIIGSNNKWSVEFGAADGKASSNTYNLIKNKGFSAVMIEPSKHLFPSLEENFKENSKVICINKFVHFDGPDTLDNILGKTKIPSDFDFLSIDIDGNDYHIWESLQNFRPRLICIEFNQTFPPLYEFVQEKKFETAKGSSLYSFIILGKKKGYELICVLGHNAFFVIKEEFHKFNISDNSNVSMQCDTSLLTYLSSGYDGEIMIIGNKQMPWHKFDYNVSRHQVLPKFLREFPPRYSKFQKLGLKIWRLLIEPKKVLSRIKEMFSSK